MNGITIDKAIKILKELAKDDTADRNFDAAEAEKLGIEALERDENTDLLRVFSKLYYYRERQRND